MNNNNLLEIGFIVLSPEPNLGCLKSTCKSIRANYKDSPVICIVPKKTAKQDIDEMSTICKTHKGKDTITSLINTGFKYGHPAWNVIVMEGAWVPSGLDKKYAKFQKADTDVFFPIGIQLNFHGTPSKLYTNFWDCSLNGIMIHKKTFHLIGNLSDETLEESRVLWAATAMDKKCDLKGILGIKIC